MANRSYLYAIDFNPNEREKLDTDKIENICEWNYGVPLCFKLLLSQNPQISKSLLFETDEPLALIADYAAGLERMYAFIEGLKAKDIFDSNELEDMLKNTREFFDNIPAKKYFLLECTELYAMSDEDFLEQNNALLAQLKNEQSCINEFYADVAKEPEEKNWLLGFGEWSDVLYYSL